MKTLLLGLAVALCIAAGCKSAPPENRSQAQPPAASLIQPSPAFFGVKLGERPHRIVFVLGGSGNMLDSIDCAKYALKSAIGALNEENQFHIIFKSPGPPREMPARRLVNASEQNKQLAMEFIDSTLLTGETDQLKAIERAFAVVGSDTIFLLMDDEYDCSVADFVKRLNREKKVKVNSIQFLYRNGEEILKQIAADSGGTYKFVSEQDLAKLAE
jgi:hypothetical protein